MKRKIVLFALGFCFGVTLAANSVLALTYGVDATTVDWGVNAYDAEKSPTDTDDDLMCWAAAASNILAWTGWGFPAGESFSNEDDIFGYYQDHWTDNGGWMNYGWDWWFDGTNDGPNLSNWSQVDKPGGGFWTEYVFSNYYHEENNTTLALKAIDNFLHEGYGVTLGVYRSGRNSGHAITVWGYEYDDQGNYLGVYVSDSDNIVPDIKE